MKTVMVHERTMVTRMMIYSMWVNMVVVNARMNVYNRMNVLILVRRKMMVNIMEK